MSALTLPFRPRIDSGTHSEVNNRETNDGEMDVFRFFDLPAELRTMILTYAIEVHIKALGRKQWRHRRQWRKPALIQTCRELRKEGLEIYHGQYVTVKRYMPNATSWTDLTVDDAFRLMLVPYKYGFNNRLSERDAERELRLTFVNPIPSTLQRFPHGLAVLRWSEDEESTVDHYGDRTYD